MRIPKLLLIVFLLVTATYSMAQNVTPMAERDGVRLRKVVPDTSVATGQTFSYNLFISVPPGLDSIRVFDVLPAGVVFHGISSMQPSLGTPTITTPAVGTNGTIRFRWIATTTTYSGMVSVVVSFPNGVTCNGLEAFNDLNAEWWRNRVYDKMATTRVRTRAIATNPWRIAKNVLGLPSVGGSCPYQTSSNEIRYRIRVYKIAGVTGQLNLVNGVVHDTLPAGAVLVGAPSCVSQSGNVLTWNIGDMSALPNLNYVDCEFTVQYPVGTTTVNNSATLSGTLGTASQPCGTVSTSSAVCVNIVPPVNSGTFTKSVSTTGQPGCGGKYYITIKNTGTETATFTIRDTMPNHILLDGVAPMTGVTILGNIVTVTGTLTPGQVRTIVIDFTVDINTALNTSITNCAYAELSSPAGDTTFTACRTFVTIVPEVKVCVWKQVCNKQAAYEIGDTLRYRLRIQNTGGVPLTGGVVSDVLSPNLAYVGNVAYDSSNNWNVPCENAAVNHWAGVSASHSGNTVTFNLPAIAPTCQDAFYNNCGAYGSPLVPFYFIEFDVRVVDTAALGNTPNLFTLSANGLTTITSNTDFVNIVGSLGIGAKKEVSANGGSTWSTSVVSTPGATVHYRLRSNIDVGSVGLRHMSFVDLLPRNNNSTTDHFLLTTCGNRGSDFDMTVIAPVSTTPSATGFNNAGGYASVNLFNPAPFAGVLFSGCGTSANTWNTTINAGDRNIGYYFGYNGIGSGSPATAIFSAKVSPSAQANTKACNTFALIGFVKYLFNTSSVPTTSFVSSLPVESETACVEINEVVRPCIEKLDYKVECKGKNTAGNQQYTISISGDNINPSGNTIKLTSPEGSFSPTSFSIPFGAFSVTSMFTDLPPVVSGSSIMVYISLYKTNSLLCIDSMEVKLPKCPDEEDCCTGFIHEFLEQSVTYDVEKDQVYLNGCVKAGPEKIQNFSYTIVSAEREIFCEKERPRTERIYGDILYSGLNISMFPGFSQWLDEITREVKWGKYKECYNLMEETLCYRSIFAFPPPPQPCEACYDVLKFAVRYSFTDCKCLTCDTIIHYTVTRRCRERSEFVKANTTPIPSFFTNRQVTVSKTGNNLQAPKK